IGGTARTLREPVTLGLWEEHLSGARPLGIVPIRPDGTCWWGSIDVDVYEGHDWTSLIKRVKDAKLRLVPVRSKSGGLHLFAFFIEPVASSTVQTWLRGVASQFGLGRPEIFPKQTEMSEDACGNWMCMPYLGTTYEGRLAEQVGLHPDGR